MNIQAIMKQAQKLQKDMMKEKEEIDNTEFEVIKSFVKIKSKGKKITSVSIEVDELSKEDIEMLQDLIQLAINELNEKIDSETEKKMGKFSQGLPGLF